MKFKYIARDHKGKRINAVATADNAGMLVARLKAEGLLPVKIYETHSSTDALKGRITKIRGRVSSKDLVVFTRQLAATLTAGLLLTEALETIAEDLENQYFQDVIRNVLQDIRGGATFSVALAKYPKVFPNTYVPIIRSGEATGSLDKTLANMAHYMEKSERLKEKVKAAISYPLFVFGFACFVVFVMVVFLIPKFAVLFENAHAQLPLLTRMVVGFSQLVLHNLLLGFILIILLVVLGWYLLKFPQVRYNLDAVKFKIPIVGKDIIRKAVVARFCRTLAVLMAGGVGIAAALEITWDVVNHLPMRDAIMKIRTRILAGSSLAEELRAQKVFPRLVSKMTAVGQRTGRIDAMLERTADYYEDELENTLQKLTSLLEPALIIFIGGVVLIVVLALYLPIFKLSAAIR